MLHRAWVVSSLLLGSADPTCSKNTNHQAATLGQENQLLQIHKVHKLKSRGNGNVHHVADVRAFRKHLKQAPPPCQGNSATWNIGWGSCDTYAPGAINSNFCAIDCSNGLCSQDVCSQCGYCGTGGTDVAPPDVYPPAVAPSSPAPVPNAGPPPAVAPSSPAPALPTAAQCDADGFQSGDGIGGSEMHIGDASSPEQCAAMVAAQCSDANGATIVSDANLQQFGSGGCWCEFGMTSRSGTHWQSCKFTAVPTPQLPAPSTPQLPAPIQPLPHCQGDSSSWNAGYGNCDTYALDGGNSAYCEYDYSDGLYSKDVCPECNQCGSGGTDVAPSSPAPAPNAGLPDGETFCQTGPRLTSEQLCLGTGTSLSASGCCHWNTDEPGDASFNGAGRCWSSIGQSLCSAR